MTSPYTPESFQLAPNISGIELNTVIASDLAERYIKELPWRRVIESMRDDDAIFLVDINGKFTDSAEHVFGDTVFEDKEILVNVETLNPLAIDQSPVYADFLSGLHQAIVSRPDRAFSLSAADRARYGLIVGDQPLEPLFSTTES